jgi:hypothetical protein
MYLVAWVFFYTVLIKRVTVLCDQWRDRVTLLSSLHHAHGLPACLPCVRYLPAVSSSRQPLCTYPFDPAHCLLVVVPLPPWPPVYLREARWSFSAASNPNLIGGPTASAPINPLLGLAPLDPPRPPPPSSALLHGLRLGLAHCEEDEGVFGPTHGGMGHARSATRRGVEFP